MLDILITPPSLKLPYLVLDIAQLHLGRQSVLSVAALDQLGDEPLPGQQRGRGTARWLTAMGNSTYYYCKNKANNLLKMAILGKEIYF